MNSNKKHLGVYMNKLEEIKCAIATLTSAEREELYEWVDEQYSSLFDAHIQADVAAGRLDGLISRALDDQRNGRLKPL